MKLATASLSRLVTKRPSQLSSRASGAVKVKASFSSAAIARSARSTNTLVTMPKQSHRSYSASAPVNQGFELKEKDFDAMSLWSMLLAFGLTAFVLFDTEAEEKKKEQALAGEKQEAVVAKVSDLKDGEMKAVKVGTTEILLVRLNGQFYATDLKCSHYGAPLNTGILNGEVVVCPWHDAKFNVKTGAVNSGPALDELRTYAVRVDGGNVLVSVPINPPKKTPKGRCDKCDKRTFVIVGAGAAGVVAAEALRQEGFTGRIVMVTKEEQLPYDRPTLSKAPGTPAEKMTLRDEAFFKAHDIEVHRGRVVKTLDANAKTIIFADGTTLNYDAALVATGGKPRELPVPGRDLDQVYTLRSYADSQKISDAAAHSKRVVIVGSSFIGMELASALKKGKKLEEVVVVGMEKVPFERVLGQQVGEILQKMAEENGVKFKLGRVVKQFEGKGKVERVVLDNGEVLPADFVVVGAGVVPATDFVQGVPKNMDGSLTVDAKMKTANESLYAAGDIARFPWEGEQIRVEHWTVAQNQGRVAARNMTANAAKPPIDFSVVPFFWTRSFDVSMHYAGHASSFDDVIFRGDAAKRQFVAYYVRNNKVMAVAAMGKANAAMAAAELFALKKMPSVAELRGTQDVDLVEVFKKATAPHSK